MDINDFVSVNITESYIVEFLSRNKNNKILQEACLKVLYNFIKTTRDYMENYNSVEYTKQKEDNILSFLRKYEDKQIQLHEDIEKNIRSIISETVTDKTNNILISMSNTLISTMNNSINESFKTWLEMWMKNSNTELSMYSIQLRDDMIKNIHPLTIYQEKIIENISSITQNISNDLDINHIRDMLKSIETNNTFINTRMTTLESTYKDTITQTLLKLQENNQLSQNQQNILQSQVNTIPLATKGVITDVLLGFEQRNQEIKSKVEETYIFLDKVEKNISNRIEILERQTLAKNIKQENCQVTKGSYGENKLFNLLSDRLFIRDGYYLDLVSGLSHCCDIVVKKDTKPTIRIECKAIGEQNNSKVGNRDIEKFQRDLIEQNNHGILVSFYSGIVGMSDYEIQQLPNGKFAIYLSNNKYDVDFIIGMIHLLYKLDTYVICSSEDKGQIVLTEDTLLRVREIVNKNNERINQLKSYAKDSINILNQMQLDMINKAILGNTNEDLESQINDTYQCEYCNACLKTSQSLARHRSNCKKNKSNIS